jgi:hypothetical protein
MARARARAAKPDIVGSPSGSPSIDRMASISRARVSWWSSRYRRPRAFPLPGMPLTRIRRGTPTLYGEARLRGVPLDANGSTPGRRRTAREDRTMAVVALRYSDEPSLWQRISGLSAEASRMQPPRRCPQRLLEAALCGLARLSLHHLEGPASPTQLRRRGQASGRGPITRVSVTPTWSEFSPDRSGRRPVLECCPRPDQWAAVARWSWSQRNGPTWLAHHNVPTVSSVVCPVPACSTS